MKTFKHTYLTLIAILFTAFAISSCTDDLNTLPRDKDEVVGDIAYGKDLSGYKSGIAKIYAGLAISGNKGGDDQSDVAGVDGGSQASFLRGLWNLQELTTDEAHCCWFANDAGIKDFNEISWSASNPFIKGIYYRFIYQVNLANEFLRETTDAKLSSRGVDDATKAEINKYRGDARFMRALAYYYLLDMFRNVPFVTENSVVGKEAPPQIMAKDLYAYIETELLECQDQLLDPFVGYHNKNYGRLTKAAAWSLLSRLYLNAEVYTGEKKYTESITYSNKVLSVGYELETKYADMFKADNDKSKEMIFPIRYQGADTQTWGGMTFLVCSTVPSSLKETINAQDAWQGNRARISLLNIFQKQRNYQSDSRLSMLRTDLSENLELEKPLEFYNGIPVVKYQNVNKDGSKPASNLVWIDFPLFRLSEIYLNYAEAVLRGGTGGSNATALTYVNDIRSRAYNGNSNSAISSADLTLDFILDERAREFFFEAQRRTDLIRFDKYTGSSYTWTWKGGTLAGASVDKKYKIFPIPSDDMGSNSNLVQNEGYN